MEFPVYDGTEHHSEYIEKLELYLKNKNNEKYEIIFNFIKEWLKDTKIELKSLNNFKNINKNLLPSNETSNEILNKYSEDIITKLDIKNKSINTKNIYDFLNNILSSINYKLNTTTNNDNVKLSIINNSLK